MDGKYLGKVINLPKPAADLLLEVRSVLTSQLGFEPSLSDTVVYLLTQWKKGKVCDDSG